MIYELHVGTFTPFGTFEAAIERLDHLRPLGITHVELMPVAEFPGTRDWGYDGVGRLTTLTARPMASSAWWTPDGVSR